MLTVIMAPAVIPYCAFFFYAVAVFIYGLNDGALSFSNARFLINEVVDGTLHLLQGALLIWAFHISPR